MEITGISEVYSFLNALRWCDTLDMVAPYHTPSLENLTQPLAGNRDFGADVFSAPVFKEQVICGWICV